MIKKIISGGQTGADRAALDVAVKLKIPYGGWLPKGRIAEDGPLPQEYLLQEMPVASYLAAAEQNVIDSDGTLIFSHGILTGSSDYARDMALRHKRQLLSIDLNQADHYHAASLVASWIKLYRIRILNVAGSRASKDPRIYFDVATILENVFQILTAEARRPTIHPEPDQNDQSAAQPETVHEAVNRLSSELKLKDKTLIAGMPEENLMDLYPSLGLYVRNRYFYPKNARLLESCRAVAADKYLHWDQAPKVIIKELWKELRGTHRLRIVR